MNDYISKDDALLHSEIIRVYSKDYGNIDVVPVEYLADIPAADVQPVNQWISVNDRLPEDNRPVLCYVSDTTDESRGYIIGSCEHGEFWFLKISGNKQFSFTYMQIKVTHWQPLPKPPKEDEE